VVSSVAAMHAAGRSSWHLQLHTDVEQWSSLEQNDDGCTFDQEMLSIRLHEKEQL
jgi:hypothetical protein